MLKLKRCNLQDGVFCKQSSYATSQKQQTWALFHTGHQNGEHLFRVGEQLSHKVLHESEVLCITAEDADSGLKLQHFT